MIRKNKNIKEKLIDIINMFKCLWHYFFRSKKLSDEEIRLQRIRRIDPQ